MATDTTVKLKVNGEVYEVDFDDLELGEVGVIEELCACSVQDIDWDSARGIQGLVWVAMHRKDPRVSLSDAGRVKFSQIEDPDTVPATANGNGSDEGEAPKKKRPTKT